MIKFHSQTQTYASLKKKKTINFIDKFDIFIPLYFVSNATLFFFSINYSPATADFQVTTPLTILYSICM